MKKFLILILSLCILCGVTGCDLVTKKSESKEEEVKKEHISSSKVKDSMKGMKLKVGVTSDMAPFVLKSKESGEFVGFDIELLQGISEYLGFEYELVEASAKDFQSMIDDGEIDFAMSGISMTDERLRKYDFTDSYYDNSIKVVVRKDSNITDRKELTKVTIGVKEGTANTEYVEEYLQEGNKIKTYKTTAKVFAALEKGKIDATIYDSTGVDYYLKTNQDTNLVALSETLNADQTKYGIMFKKGYKYVDYFNVALQVLNTDGEYQKIEEKWITAGKVEE